MKPGEKRRGRMGTLEVETAPFWVTVPVPAYGFPGARKQAKQVRVLMLTGEMKGEPRQWLAAWVEVHFPTVVQG